MMDVVFSRSACGSLKMAQHYGQGIRRRLRQCTADGDF